MASTTQASSLPMPDNVRKMVDAMEGQAAAAMEQLVAGEGFSELLVRMTENVVAVSKLTADAYDLILRNLRLAGRGDIDRLARQLLRNEDKLELLLQAVERQEASSERR
ncbi:MAG: hypothetical protein QOF83_2399 [Solirubrobacteraceae bacterium]|jgi:hypothetical protein|nr:hypothetical protein [Solirubrobacteraceae bacterium]